MRTRRATLGGVTALFALTGACGSSDVLEPAKIHVGGSYPTAVTLRSNTCGQVEVLPQTTTVQHTAGARTFSMTHGPITYPGALETNGDFTTTPVHPPSDNTTTLTVAGRFRTTGFDATVTVVVAPPGAATCQYTVEWVGTKTGSPNVIP